ncbi:AAA family ATPase [Methanocella sp. MCL-LM]|uniref:AAA family ATPase n=1 Tax=Methanocella sp. MCL-LM TaxID=3412035 RepID=UPI003C732C67
MGSNTMGNKGNHKNGITGITVAGYKSLLNKTSIQISSLTILAGANSSGKSSIMQPLLMMKQTLDEVYDPGDLLISGPHVNFNSADNFISKFGPKRSKQFSIKIDFDEDKSISESFTKGTNKPVELVETKYKIENNEFEINGQMSERELINKYPIINDFLNVFSNSVFSMIKDNKNENTYDEDITEKLGFRFNVQRKRCFLGLMINTLDVKTKTMITEQYFPFLGFENLLVIENYITRIIHVPALRTNTERTYKTTAVGPRFPGTIDNYVASIINSWKLANDPRLSKLNEWLSDLSLTSKIDTNKVTDTQVEILVHRLSTDSDDEKDMVNIADVGFGIGQTLPVLVALLIAEKDQLVYIEQPEVHLHPKAQYNMANIIVEAANRGVKVVIETHSMLLLTGIQTLIAEGKIPYRKVKLHWFARGNNGESIVKSASFDKAGAFGECPIDFADIALEADSRYLDASD